MIGSPPRTLRNQDHKTSWTDDVPVCNLSGIGFSTNQIYRADGNRQDDHENEDRSFHFRLDQDCYLYGVFDGHNGSIASNFATQRLPAELLFGQLSGVTDCEDIKNILSQSFLAVEKTFFEQLDKLLAERAALLLQLPEGLSAYDTLETNPEIAEKIKDLDRQISGGTTAAIALLLNGKLYVANVGDSRVVLVRVNEQRDLLVSQLSEDHTISNVQELDRLSQLKLDINVLKNVRQIGSSDNTRCIGDYHVKGGHLDIDYLSTADGDPVIAEPSVVGGLPVDDTCLFLFIMSDGLYHALQDATGTQNENSDVAKIIAHEFTQQSTLNGVAQAVVDKVVRIHHDTYLLGLQNGQHVCQKRGDITLLVRNFNCPLPCYSPPAPKHVHPVSVPFHQNQRLANVAPTLFIPSHTQAAVLEVTNQSVTQTPTNIANQNLTDIGTNTSTGTSRVRYRFSSTRRKRDKLELDVNGQIEAYVDFSRFHDIVAGMSPEKREALIQELMPKTRYEPIPEDQNPTEDLESSDIVTEQSSEA